MARARDKSSHWTEKVINNDYNCIHHIPHGSETARDREYGHPAFHCFHNPRTAHAEQRIRQRPNPRNYISTGDEIIPLTARLSFLNEFAPLVIPRGIALDPTVYSLNFPRNILELENFNPILAGDFTATPLRNFSVTFHHQEITCVCCPPMTCPLFSIVVNFHDRTVSVLSN